MGKPWICADNVFDTSIYPDHTVDATEEATGHPVEHLANWRRQVGNTWASTSTNTIARTDVICDRVRGVDFVGIDRGSNVIGDEVTIEHSMDDFTSLETSVDGVTIPAFPGPGNVTDPLGVHTLEGAWLKRIDLRAALHHRLTVPAISGDVAEIVGLWIGKGYEPEYFGRPWHDDMTSFEVVETMSDHAWRGRGNIATPRRGTIRWNLLSEAEYLEVRFHLELFRDGHPMWVIMDQDQSEKAVLAVRDRGEFGFGRETDYGWRRGEIPWVEHQQVIL